MKSYDITPVYNPDSFFEKSGHKSTLKIRMLHFFVHLYQVRNKKPRYICHIAKEKGVCFNELVDK